MFLAKARSAAEDLGRKTAALIAGATDTTITPAGFDWSVRDLAVHLVHGTRLYAGMAAAPSPVTDLADLEACCQRFIDESPQLGSDELAALVDVAVTELVEAITDQSGDQPVAWHGGVPLTLAEAVAVLVGEYVLHGYDIATALGVPWPIDPAHAARVVRGYQPLLALLVDPDAAAGHTATYAVDLDGQERFTVRFIDGEVGLGADTAPIDCTLSADPVAFLLVMSGRLSRWSAVALGLLRGSGARPGLAYGYHDLFGY